MKSRFAIVLFILLISLLFIDIASGQGVKDVSMSSTTTNNDETLTNTEGKFISVKGNLSEKEKVKRQGKKDRLEIKQGDRNESLTVVKEKKIKEMKVHEQIREIYTMKRFLRRNPRRI